MPRHRAFIASTLNLLVFVGGVVGISRPCIRCITDDIAAINVGNYLSQINSIVCTCILMLYMLSALLLAWTAFNWRIARSNFSEVPAELDFPVKTSKVLLLGLKIVLLVVLMPFVAYNWMYTVQVMIAGGTTTTPGVLSFIYSVATTVGFVIPMVAIAFFILGVIPALSLVIKMLDYNYRVFQSFSLKSK